MSDAPELPPRPLPPRGAVTVVGEWLRWIGIARLVTSAVSVLIVVGGAVWLLRAPAPATEASIPLAQGSAPTVTLAVPPTAHGCGSSATTPAAAAAGAAGRRRRRCRRQSRRVPAEFAGARDRRRHRRRRADRRRRPRRAEPGGTARRRSSASTCRTPVRSIRQPFRRAVCRRRRRVGEATYPAAR